MTSQDVVLCGVCSSEQRTDIGYVCADCTSAWRARLHGVRTLMAHLRTVTARLAVIDRPTIAGGEQPEDRDETGRLLPGTLAAVAAPADLTAMQAADDIRCAVAWTALELCDAIAPPCEHFTCTGGVQPACQVADRHRTVAAASRQDPVEWLAHRIGALRKAPFALQAHDDTTRAIRRGWALVDHAPDTGWFAGYCDAELVDGTPGAHAGTLVECGRALYARLDAATVTCPACRTRHDVATRREHLLAAADDTLTTAADAARILTRLGRPTTSAMVRGWVHRGHLTHTDMRGYDPLYRLGDVRAVDSRIRYGLAPREAS